MKIFLMGFMGSGKTTLGQVLADALGFDFVDIDQFIETIGGRSIPDIFREDGEAGFRQIETNALHGLVEKEKTVIALGGGTPCFFDNLNWINDRGISVYLQLSPKLLATRLSQDTRTRPLIAGLTKTQLQSYIQEQLNKRKAFYEQAHIVFNSTDNLEGDVALLKAHFSELIKA